MSSTHTGNPLCCAAAIATINTLREEGLIARAASLGAVAQQALVGLRRRNSRHLGAISGKGLVWGMYVLGPGTGQLDPNLAQCVIGRCTELGLLMLPTGSRGALKLAPPLSITPEALTEGIEVVSQALGECIGSSSD
jgi:4-aminobutyrate aminotransferase-like enzyme